jgi:hypothetical protein
MPKSNVATLVVGIVAAVLGYLIVDRSAAENVTNWLRQEIRKETPDYHHGAGGGNDAPVVTNQGL